MAEMQETASYLKALGLRIRDIRASRGYSQEKFAAVCGVHRTFMGAIERGESNVSFQNILRIATAAGVSLESLFKGIEIAAKKHRPKPLDSQE